jgi:uncharacterized protein YpmB
MSPMSKADIFFWALAIISVAILLVQGLLLWMENQALREHRDEAHQRIAELQGLVKELNLRLKHMQAEHPGHEWLNNF